MRKFGLIICIIFLLWLSTTGGCQPDLKRSGAGYNSNFDKLAYDPVKVEILPLTEVTLDSEDTDLKKIRTYVSLIDAFESQIKSPVVFRFELYQRIPRSTEQKGKRIFIWPDIDLTDATENNKHWRDFLRAYEIELLLDAKEAQSSILRITCLCPNGRRLWGQLDIKL